MLAASPSGIVGVGPRTALEISFASGPGVRLRLLDALVSGTDAAAVAEVAGTELVEARSLIEQLSSLGALSDKEREPPPPRGLPLASAVLRLEDDSPFPDLIWTAAEALVVPPGLDRAARRALLRAFIAGIEPRERRVAYGHAALWKAPTVVGDVPPRRALDAALERAGSAEGEIVVLDLDGGASTSLDPAELGRIGVDRTHRLGPVTSIAQAQLGDDPPLHLVSARMALPNIAHAEPAIIGLSGKGTGPSIEAAETIARAEAAERYGSGEIAGRRLVRASEHELDGAVAGAALLLHNARQHA